MRPVFIAVFAVIATVVFASDVPIPPMIPTQWQAAYFEIHLENGQNPSLTSGRTYTDYNANAQRLDQAFSGGVQSVLLDYTSHQLHALQTGAWNGNQPQCVAQPYSNTLIPQNIFQGATYAGREVKNDQLCDIWIVTQWGPSYTTNLTLWWGVAEPGPVASRVSLTDGSQYTETAYVNFTPSINLPPGWNLFGVPALCTGANSKVLAAPYTHKGHRNAIIHSLPRL
jgi:hypothetical protein